MITHKKKGRPTNRPDAGVLTALYKDHTAREIAEQYGVAITTVQAWITRYRKEPETAMQEADTNACR